MKFLGQLPLPIILAVASLLASPVLSVPAVGNEQWNSSPRVASSRAGGSRNGVSPHNHGSSAAMSKDRFRAQNRGPGKYFQEAGGSVELGHYDGRYFHGELSYDEHKPVLRDLIRSYLTIFRVLGLETWLAHGTLLGWWWNGRIMPWDTDLDVQVSVATMEYLAANLNRTRHEYRFTDDATGDEDTKTYLLDVNPNAADRKRGNGKNVIDARWIDIRTGMFIDITALAEVYPDRLPGVWTCKNNHQYRTRDLFPMRESEFEGVPATVPYSFDRILTEEYGMSSMVMTVWQGHEWNPEVKEWVKKVKPVTHDSHGKVIS